MKGLRRRYLRTQSCTEKFYKTSTGGFSAVTKWVKLLYWSASCGSCTRTKESQMEFSDPGLAWPSIKVCGHSGNELVNGRSPSIFLPVSPPSLSSWFSNK